jgi:hypothetical protein
MPCRAHRGRPRSGSAWAATGLPSARSLAESPVPGSFRQHTREGTRPSNKGNGSPHPFPRPSHGERRYQKRKNTERVCTDPLPPLPGASLPLCRLGSPSPVPMFAAGSGPGERRWPCPPPPRFWCCPQLCVAEAHEKDRQWRASQPAWGDVF